MAIPTNKNLTPIMGNCLRCQGLVRVPATAPTKSTVKCPHCDHSFLLSEILNQAVPELEIVESGQPQTAAEEQIATEKDAEGRFVVANQLRQTSKRSRRARRRSSSRSESTEGMVMIPKSLPEVESGRAGPAQRTESNGSHPAAAITQSQLSRESFDSRRSSGSSSRRRESSSSDSSRSRSSSRSSSKEPSVVFEILKVVFGGALAIPIAYLLVLWVFRQDPLHVAPTIYKSAPFLLPDDFKVDEEEASAVTPGNSQIETENVEEVLDVSSGLPKPRLDPDDVGIN